MSPEKTFESRYTIAIDAMGGDHAPHMVMAGLDLMYDYLVENRIGLLLFGKPEALAPHLAKYSRLGSISRVVQAADVVAPDARPSKVIRSGRNTSMWMAIESVRNNEADAVVSAGNTGCVMGISKLLISMIEGIRRPAITTQVPNAKGSFTVLLDLGANAECDEHNIFQFGIMGSLYSQIINGNRRPTVGILNIGSEAGKGLEYLNRASEMTIANRMNLSFDYVGFVEGSDIFKGEADVIVSDGFSGNVALKTLEGTATFVASLIKQMFKKSFMALVGYFFLRSAFKPLKKKIDVRNYNGAVFLGLNGIVVKSHGGTDAFGFANAVKYAANLVAGDFDTKLKAEMEKVES
ncbi:MAG: phosphate acyltransferase PlsX [Rickettsiales bacterium]|jgi:glycerol-3-phosphate acyltransferase PlsX|nr:phosphate acyltransferase PlsX [Rickettsiales bacterium]